MFHLSVDRYFRKEDVKQIDKEHKHARSNIQRLSNKLKTDFATKKFKTFGEYLKYGLGYTDQYISNVLHFRGGELTRTITFSELKELIDDIRLSMEVKWWLHYNPPTPDTEVYETLSNNEGHTINTLQLLPDNKEGVSLRASTDDSLYEKDYGLQPSEKENCKLFWFQKKYAKQTLDKIIVEKKNGVLLVAGAGNGKTFILGAVIRRLLDMNFHVGRTISPWPYFYITKASVVEQTKRVLENKFNINTVTECMVTNYDQLRATLGEIFLKEKTIVTNGEPHIIWEWRKHINPCVFIIDECHSAKNEDSTQATIINAIANIEDPNVVCIFSSATPFARVSESKYFVLNCRKNIELF